MPKAEKYVKVSCDAVGITYMEETARLSLELFVIGLVLSISTLFILLALNVRLAGPILFFCAAILFFYIRAKVGLRELDEKLSNSPSPEVEVTAGWDGAGKYLKFGPIPLDGIGILLGVAVSLYAVLRPLPGSGVIILLCGLFLFSGAALGISLFYFVLEMKYKAKIRAFRYSRDGSLFISPYG